MGNPSPISKRNSCSLYCLSKKKISIKIESTSADLEIWQWRFLFRSSLDQSKPFLPWIKERYFKPKYCWAVCGWKKGSSALRILNLLIYATGFSDVQLSTSDLCCFFFIWSLLFTTITNTVFNRYIYLTIRRVTYYHPSNSGRDSKDWPPHTHTRQSWKKLMSEIRGLILCIHTYNG